MWKFEIGVQKSQTHHGPVELARGETKKGEANVHAHLGGGEVGTFHDINVHAHRLQEGVRLAQEREDDAERKNDIKGGFLRPYFVQLRPHYR